MKQPKEGDSMLVKVGNYTIPSFVVYSGPRLFAPLEKPNVIDVAYKVNKEWRFVNCSKQMCGGETRIVLSEKTLRIFN